MHHLIYRCNKHGDVIAHIDGCGNHSCYACKHESQRLNSRPIQSNYDSGRSNSPGTSDSPQISYKHSMTVLKVLDRITAQQEMFVGISWEPLDAEQLYPWAPVGQQTTEQILRDKVNVSFAKLKRELWDLFILVKRAESNITDSPEDDGSSIK